MAWEVEFTDEFGDRWETLREAEQDAIDQVVRVLERVGPRLKEPLSKRVESSRHFPDMKELRVSAGGRRLRIFYAFDPRRMAILLIGGDKTGDWNSFYERMIPIAVALYDEHLESINRER
jgi:hypothetical protein